MCGSLHRSSFLRGLSAAALFASSIGFALPAEAAEPEPEKRPAEGVQDNSFLIEEAYNQDPGVVQHILSVTHQVSRMSGPDEREWQFVFTQEWPVFSQTHQLSYTVPYNYVSLGDESDHGFDDVLLNYRFQALKETATQPAFAPRLSLILPTGNADKGFGNDTAGFQTNLPVSKIVSDRWTLHGNAGATFFPDVASHDLVSYNLAASAIYAITPAFNFMLESTANWDEEVNDDGSAERNLSALLSPGFRYAFDFANDAQAVIGLAAPIGLTSHSPDFGVILYASFEHYFSRSKEAKSSTK